MPVNGNVYNDGGFIKETPSSKGSFIGGEYQDKKRDLPSRESLKF